LLLNGAGSGDPTPYHGGVAQTSRGSSKVRTQDARQRAQVRREAIAKAERRRRLMFGGLGGIVVLVVVAVLVFVFVDISQTKKGSADVTAAAPASVASDLASIPASAFSTVGVTGVGTTVSGISAISGGTPVTTNGLPTVVYVGAEYCPYCAGERWALASALSRFGTFSGLQTTMSSGTDVDPNTATLSFLTTKFASSTVAFAPAEVEDRAGKTLQTPGKAEEASFAKYGDSSYPYVSIDNKYKVPLQYDPAILKGMTAIQIAAALDDPTSTVAKNVLASANVITAGICAVTGQKPDAVCSSPEVEAAAADLNVQAGSTGSSSASPSS
jgi:hypothetical protein